MAQVAYVLLGTALVGGLVQALVHARHDVYYIPLYGVGMAVGAFVVAATGIGLGWRTGRFGRVALTTLAVMVALVGVVSFGVLLLALVLACSVLALRASRGRQDAAATGAGVLLGLGVSVLALVALSPPLVDCADGSAGENVFMGLGSNSASGSASSSASSSADRHTNRGRAQGETYAYSYTCRNGKLMQFSIRQR